MQADSPTPWLITWASDFTTLLNFLTFKVSHPGYLDQDKDFEECQAVSGI